MRRCAGASRFPPPRPPSSSATSATGASWTAIPGSSTSASAPSSPGTVAAATEWKKANDPEDRFTIIDTGAASGRLGLLAVAVARFAREDRDAEAVIRFAREGVERCEEYVFLDRLQYLAAGGRLSRSGAFFGDMLHMKPIITPLADGARKVGVVRDRAGQLRFALEKLEAALKGEREGPHHARVHRQRPLGDRNGAARDRAAVSGGGDPPPSHVPHLGGAHGAGDLGGGLPAVGMRRLFLRDTRLMR